MQKILSSIIVACLLLVVASCKHELAYKEVQSANGLCTMDIPGYMIATTSIFNGPTILQYGNDSAALYVAVCDTSRRGLHESTLNDYYHSAVNKPQSDSAVLDSASLVSVNGDSVMVTKLVESIGGVKIAFHIEIIATPTHFFYIQLWTKYEADKTLKPVIDKMMNSFRDINHS